MPYTSHMDIDKVLENWNIQARKGVLELCTLNALNGERLYGYDIVKRLRVIDGLVIGEGTIYPILSRFRAEGLVAVELEESSGGPARKYYKLTSRGEKVLGRLNAAWDLIEAGIKSLRRSSGCNTPGSGVLEPDAWFRRDASFPDAGNRGEFYLRPR